MGSDVKINQKRGGCGERGEMWGKTNVMARRNGVRGREGVWRDGGWNGEMKGGISEVTVQ